MFEVKFPAIYERISTPRSEDEVMRELDRRTGYPCNDCAAPVKTIDPRAGSHWDRNNPNKKRVTTRNPLPPQQSRKTCPHSFGVSGGGNGREQCRGCGQSRAIGSKSWKSMAGKKTKGSENRPFRKVRTA